MLKSFCPRLLLALVIAVAAPVFADADPSVSQIYETARAGHLTQAQQMIQQVLRDHPESAKAHYVAAELYARQGNVAAGRQELNVARGLSPGLAFAKPSAVQALERQLSRAQPTQSGTVLPQRRSSFPWGMLIVLVVVAMVLWLIFRRRNPPNNGYSYSGAVPGRPGGGIGGGAGVAPNVGSGIGSGIAGGLASGLAVGAGVVAGEEIARHFLDSDRHEGAMPPPSDESANEDPGNQDLGGSDFGMSDPSGWDDDDASSLGGDDWS
jgi:hypothetical protein